MKARQESAPPYAAFAARLIQAVQERGLTTSPSRFAREVNAAAAGLIITSHGVRKWFLGEAMPTQERLKLLAQILGVSAAWLRFGEAEKNPPLTGELSSELMMILSDYARLPPEHKVLVRELVKILHESSATVG